MAYTTYKIDDYRISLMSHPVYSAIIVLYNKSLNNILGRIYFTRTAMEVSVSVSGTIVNLYVPESCYGSYVDLLRNESPVFFEFDVASSYKMANLKTDREPTGDGDLPQG
jgi:hypothetical protein